MKSSQLSKIRSKFNDEGNYDKNLYLTQQKAIYERQINYSTRVDAITEQQFSLRPLQISFLNSTALKDERKFKQVKKLMTDYNKNIIQKGGSATGGLHLKKVVMDSMLKFMRLMILAPDTNTKKVILDVAHHWFIQHLDPKSAHKTSKQLQKQIKQIVIQKQLLPIQLVNQQLILNRVNQQLLPYRIKARTLHQEIDDPKIQLQNYNTHKLQFISERIKCIDDKKKKKKWIDSVKFPKIQPIPYLVQQPQGQKKEQPNQQNADQQGSPPKKPPQISPSSQPIADQGPTQQQVQKQQNQPPAQLQAQISPQQQPDQQQPQQIQQQKKKGKLDPLLKAFVLQRIRNKQKQQVNCEKIRRKQLNVLNSTHDEDLLQGGNIREWAKQRARLKSQIARKNQSMRGLDKIPRGRKDDSVTFLQNDMDATRMKTIISESKRGITSIQLPPDQLNSEAGLTLFDRRRVRSEASKKPFSSILYDHSRKAQQNLLLDQITSLKQKFSKYKMYTPMDKIIKGLVPPDEQYFEDADGKLVWPNSQLMSNPHLKAAKKKKKKKKKK